MLVGQTKRLDQIPGKPRLRIKITEHLEGLIGIVDNFVQSRLVHPRCFVALTTSRLNLAVSSNKLFRTRTVVPNAGGLTDLIAGSSYPASHRLHCFNFNFNVTCAMQDMLVTLAATSTNVLMDRNKNRRQFVNIILATIIQTYHLVFQNNFTCLPNVLTSLIA